MKQIFINSYLKNNYWLEQKQFLGFMQLAIY